MTSPTILPPISSAQYTILSFDLYGTLIDWESGIYPHLRPLLASPTLAKNHPYLIPFPSTPAQGQSLAPEHPLLRQVSTLEGEIQDANPSIKFEDVLRGAYERIAADTGAEVKEQDLQAVIRSSREWQPFPDTVSAMKALHASGRYKFVALSNNSRAGLKAVLAGPLKDVHFDLAYSAEEAGAYKPSQKTFEYMLDGIRDAFGVGKDSVLHCAHGVGSDQVVCEEMGIRHVWVERGVDNWRGKSKTDGMSRLAVVKDAEDFARKLLTKRQDTRVVL